MRFSAISAIGLLALSASASPTGNNPGNELVSRATRSSQGWYSYGCYMDCYDGMERYLPHFAYKDASNSPNKCIDACKGAGFNYAGLQFGDECYCGSQLAGPPTKPAECNVKCADGNKCGGPCRNNIWAAVAKAGH